MPRNTPEQQSLDWVKKLPSSAPKPGGAKARYAVLEEDRSHHLIRARENAWVTIPRLMRPEGWTANHGRDQPWQSAGAEGVNHLASKFNLTLFPPQGAFFRLEPDELALRQAEQQAQELAQFDPRVQQAMPEGLVSRVHAAAAVVEKAVMRQFDVLGVRARMQEALLQLIVAGNALLYIGEYGAKVYQMDRYVVRRNGEGQVQEILVKEILDKQDLPETISKDAKPGREAEVFTWVKYDYKNDAVHWWQEHNGQRLPDSISASSLDGCPWIPMRFSSEYGDSYGEGMVRSLLGDLVMLDGIRESTGQGYVISSRLVFVVRPGAGFTREQWRRAPNGEVLPGDPNGVGAIQGGKAQDLAGAAAYEASLEQRIQRNAGMPISMQRKGERVTASEFSALASQLEAVTAGFYSLFSYEVQPQIVNRLLHVLVRKGRLDAKNMLLPNGEKVFGINPITGLAALGRNDDYRKLLEFIQTFQTAYAGQDIGKYINLSELSQRIANSLGMNSDGLVYSKEEIQAREQAAMQAQAEREQQAAEMQREQQDENNLLNSKLVQELARQGQLNNDPNSADIIRQAPSG